MKTQLKLTFYVQGQDALQVGIQQHYLRNSSEQMENHVYEHAIDFRLFPKTFFQFSYQPYEYQESTTISLLWRLIKRCFYIRYPNDRENRENKSKLEQKNERRAYFLNTLINESENIALVRGNRV